MPILESGSHHLDVLTTATLTEQAQTPAAHDCHPVMAEHLSETYAQLAPDDELVQQGDCHDGHCQVCGVCHQGLSLTSWPVLQHGVLAHPLPVSASWVHRARSSAPLTKPPIS